MGLGWHCLSTKFVKRLNGFEAFIHSVPGQHRAALNTVWLKATNDQPRECSHIVFIVWDIFFLKQGTQLSSLICNFTGNVPSASHLSAKLTDSHSLCSCTFCVVFSIPPQIFLKENKRHTLVCSLLQSGHRILQTPYPKSHMVPYASQWFNTYPASSPHRDRGHAMREALCGGMERRTGVLTLVAVHMLMVLC